MTTKNVTIIDISHHQRTIEWDKLSKVLDLAVIRVQYGSKTIDREYKTYVAEAKKYGVPFGHYAYALFKDVADAVIEAKNFLARIDKDAKFLVVDVEEQTCTKPADLVPATQAFVDECKKAGYQVGLYSGDYFYKKHNLSKVNVDFLWIANYGINDGKAHNKPSVPCDLWQFTSKGKLDGVVTYLDMNKLNGTKTLDYFTGKKPAPAPKPPVLKPKPRYPYPGLLKEGSKGKNVELLQKALGVKVDGDFGSATKTAVMTYQRKHKPLVVDGLVGVNTWNTIFKYV